MTEGDSLYTLSLQLLLIPVLTIYLLATKEIIINIYKSKYGKRFLSLVIAYTSLNFPLISFIFMYSGIILDDIKVEHMLFLFLLLLINFIIKKYITDVRNVSLYSTLLHSLFIINMHYEIANNTYFAIYLVIISFTFIFIKYQFGLVSIVFNVNGKFESIEAKKDLVRTHTKIKLTNSDGERLSLKEFLDGKFKNEDSKHVFLDNVIKEIYSDTINRHTFNFHIIMCLLTLYFLLSQI
ncbi:hypothetical protein [Staphylococcus phage vB_StaM_SA1]|nr:hypothetical protein [Staphylococcus phage vB_StaM_SA1]